MDLFRDIRTYGSRDIHVDSGGYPKTRSLILSLQIVLVTLFILCLDPSEEIIISASAIRLGEGVNKKRGEKIGKFIIFSESSLLTY